MSYIDKMASVSYILYLSLPQLKFRLKFARLISFDISSNTNFADNLVHLKFRFKLVNLFNFYML
jgi:hypothetical protein